MVLSIDQMYGLALRFGDRITELARPRRSLDRCESQFVAPIMLPGEADTSAAETAGTVKEEDSSVFKCHSRSIATARCEASGRGSIEFE